MTLSRRWLNFLGAVVILGTVGGVGLLAGGILRTFGDGDEALIQEPSRTPTIATATPAPTPDPTSTPTPNPAVPPAPVPYDVAAYRAVYVRNPVPLDGQAGGELWLSSLDGSGARRLTRDGELATFAGVATHPATGGVAAFFVSLDGGTAQTVWTVDIQTGERLKLFSFESLVDDEAHADVSPNGRYVAYAHAGGIDYVDLLDGDTRHLLDNGPNPCDASNCMAHVRPRWSPDGTLLMARRGFWEGGMTVIFDPFAAQIVPITNGSTDGPQFAYWSPDGASACGHTGYGESDLNFAESPGWIFTKAIEDTGTVARCAWIDRQNVAFTVNASRPDSDGDRVPENFVELYVLERATGQARLIAEFGQGISIVSAGLEAIPASRWLVTQNRVTERGAFEDYLSQPEVFDVDSGARTPVLQQGDWIIAVLPP